MSDIRKSTGHPAGLWVLFTTELWERFAFYAMRAILVLYLIAEADRQGNPGFGWSEADAYMLYGWYTSLVYVAPLFGGWLADTFLGQRRSVIIGAILMALGEFCLFTTELIRLGDGTPITLATDPTALTTFYVGLGLMILGNGFFKPCISAMVGQLYEPGDRRRDSAFTIFYMGINIGAAISPFVSSTLAVKCGFQWGFFAAGIGMCIGLLVQLTFSPYFLKRIGTLEKRQNNEELTPKEKEKHEKKMYEQTRPLVKQDWDRMFVIVVLSLFVIAFWLTFEQAGSSLNVFAEKSTDRLVPSPISAITTFQMEAKQGKIEEAQRLEQNAIDAEKILQELQNLSATDLADADTSLAKQVEIMIERTQKRIKDYRKDAKRANIESETHPANWLFSGSEDYFDDRAKYAEENAQKAEKEAANAEAATNQALALLNRVRQFTAELQTEESERTVARFEKMAAEFQDKAENTKKWAVNARKQTEITREGDYVFPAAWYQSVNAIFIVIFAPIFTLMWNFLYRLGIEPSTPVKFALGILLVSASFLVMIPGAKHAAETGGNAAAYWLLACYLFATWGELCLSPVGLSMVTKLAPARYVSVFMGIWFLASATAYWLAGYCAAIFAAGEGISIFFGKEGGLADFFLLLAIVPAVVGLLALAMAPMLKRRMHGIH